MNMMKIMSTMSVLRIWIRMRCIGLSPGSSGNVRIIARETRDVYKRQELESVRDVFDMFIFDSFLPKEGEKVSVS